MKKGLKKFYNLVEALESLPTIGKKSALRLAYHMLFHDHYNASKIAHAIEDGLQSIRKCEKCGSMSENELCEICLDEHRDNTTLCLVESSKDIFYIEESNQYNGRYFVLDSIEPNSIAKLKLMVKEDEITEMIFAFSPSISNDAIILFVEDKLSEFNITFSKIAQGVPTGVSLENVDILSLSKAFESRTKV